MSYPDNESGFTLIELILVIGIIGILTSISVIAGREMYINYKLRGAVRQVYSDMQYARVTAIKTGKETIVDWDSDTRGIYYEVKWKGGGALPKRGGKIYFTGPLALHKIGGLKVCHYSDVSASPVDTQFNPNGSANNGGARLSAGKKRFKVYVSSSGTGNVRILNTQDLAQKSDEDNCL